MTREELLQAYAAGQRDFSGVNLRYADLSGAVLRGAVLRGADLSGAVLSCANLRGADLHGANLRGANLSYADLSDADLSYANLSCANLRGANLRGAVLSGAVLSGAVLSRAVLPTGETWEVYQREVVPALLTAGGHPVSCESWSCHDWTNCLVASAFAVSGLEQVPVLYRPRCAQLIQFFDSGLITKEGCGL